MPLKMAYPKSKHHVYTSFYDTVSNYVIQSFHKTFKAWYKTAIVLHLLWISFLIFCFIIILSIFIFICLDKCLLLLQMFHTLKSLIFILKIFSGVGFYLYAFL